MDSRVGAQIEYRVSPTIDLVGQIVVRDHFKADLDNSTELAYVAVRPQTEVDIRAGRINYDAFLMSDHRNVGYAYAWVRPQSGRLGSLRPQVYPTGPTNHAGIRDITVAIIGSF